MIPLKGLISFIKKFIVVRWNLSRVYKTMSKNALGLTATVGVGALELFMIKRKVAQKVVVLNAHDILQSDQTSGWIPSNRLDVSHSSFLKEAVSNPLDFLAPIQKTSTVEDEKLPQSIDTSTDLPNVNLSTKDTKEALVDDSVILLKNEIEVHVFNENGSSTKPHSALDLPNSTVPPLHTEAKSYVAPPSSDMETQTDYTVTKINMDDTHIVVSPDKMVSNSKKLFVDVLNCDVKREIACIEPHKVSHVEPFDQPSENLSAASELQLALWKNVQIREKTFSHLSLI